MENKSTEFFIGHINLDMEIVAAVIKEGLEAGLLSEADAEYAREEIEKDISPQTKNTKPIKWGSKGPLQK